MVTRGRGDYRWTAIAFALLTVAAVPILPRLRNAVEPRHDGSTGQSLHTVSLQGEFLEIRNDTVLRPSIGGWVFASSGGDSLGAAPIDSGR